MKVLFILFFITFIGCTTSNYKFITTAVKRQKGGIVETFQINGKNDSFGQSGYTIKKLKCQNNNKTKVTFLFYEAHNSNEPLPIAFVQSKKIFKQNRSNVSNFQVLEIEPQKARFKIDFLGTAPVLTNKFKINQGDSVIIQSYLVYVQYFVD